MSAEIAFARRVEFNAFGFEESLLQVYGNCEFTGGAFPLRIYYTLPRHFVGVGSVHYEADGACGVAFAEDDRELAVGHHAAARYISDDAKYAFAILFIIDRRHSILRVRP